MEFQGSGSLVEAHVRLLDLRWPNVAVALWSVVRGLGVARHLTKGEARQRAQDEPSDTTPSVPEGLKGGSRQ